MSGFPSFSDIARDIKNSIKESLRETICRKKKCTVCKRVYDLKEMSDYYLGGKICNLCNSEKYYWDEKLQKHIER